MDKIWEISHCLYKIGGVKLFARAFELLGFIINSNAISAKASIGKGTVFHHHGCGCVIHDKTIIGKNCKIFQNTTIGSKWSNGICEGGAPVIGDNVFIGAGAVILGDITIGDNSIIGANAVVLNNIPSNVIAIGIPAKIITNRMDVE